MPPRAYTGIGRPLMAPAKPAQPSTGASGCDCVGKTGEITLAYEGDPEGSPNKWWVQFEHRDSEVIEESLLELYRPG